MQNLETLKLKGEWNIFLLSDEITADSPVVQKIREIARGKIANGKKVITDLKNKKIIEKIIKQFNLTPMSGFSVFTRLLAGETTYTGEITHIALGSGSSAFSTASIKLNTEIFRKIVSSASFDDNIAYIDAFIASADVGDQTFHEVGAFIDGTGSADSGQAFSLAVQDIVKSGSLFLSLKITLSQ